MVSEPTCPRNTVKIAIAGSTATKLWNSTWSSRVSICSDANHVLESFSAKKHVWLIGRKISHICTPIASGARSTMPLPKSWICIISMERLTGTLMMHDATSISRIPRTCLGTNRRPRRRTSSVCLAVSTAPLPQSWQLIGKIVKSMRGSMTQDATVFSIPRTLGLLMRMLRPSITYVSNADSTFRLSICCRSIGGQQRFISTPMIIFVESTLRLHSYFFPIRRQVRANTTYANRVRLTIELSKSSRTTWGRQKCTEAPFAQSVKHTLTRRASWKWYVSLRNFFEALLTISSIP